MPFIDFIDALVVVGALLRLAKNRILNLVAVAVVLVATFGSAGPVRAASVLVLTGSGTSSLDAPLTGAGFTVIHGTLAPGEIAANLDASVVAVYVWNDGSLGNTGSAEIPALAFNAADQSALTAFRATHSRFILDGLAWRSNVGADDVALSQNEILALSAAGGGIVLGADDSSGALIVQHVNQVASWFNLNPFAGVYSTPSSIQLAGGSLFTAPNAVNPAGLDSTFTYSEVPHGLQPNGIFLATALFGSPSAPTTGFGSDPLASDTFDGVTYPSVNHVITTDIPGGGIPVPEPGTLSLSALTFAFLLVSSRARSRDERPSAPPS